MKPAIFTPAELVVIRTRVAAGETAAAIAETFGCARKTICLLVARHNLGPWRSRGGDDNRRLAQSRRPIPCDFAQHAAVEHTAELCKRYGVGKDQIRTWRDACGLPALLATAHNKGGRPRGEMPESFAVDAGRMTQRELAAKYHAAPQTIRRWQRAIGIVFQSGRAGVNVARANTAKPAHLVRNAYQTTPVDRAVKDGSRAGMAADYLRKFGAVYRCTPMGGADLKGSHWRRGSAILTDAEIVERAEYNGWQPDAWKQVRAA
ncbi:hypothetical protein O6V14_04720 [Sphingomonas faeni]|uniref:hypothetical protein n=1 Tax=Sphingomonas faeni TaxID=185950 RepID=UPI0033566735